MFKTSLLLAGLTYLASAQEVTNCAEPTTLFGELKRSFLGQSEDAVTDCVLASDTNSTMEVS